MRLPTFSLVVVGLSGCLALSLVVSATTRAQDRPAPVSPVVSKAAVVQPGRPKLGGQQVAAPPAAASAKPAQPGGATKPAVTLAQRPLEIDAALNVSRHLTQDKPGAAVVRISVSANNYPATYRLHVSLAGVLGAETPAGFEVDSLEQRQERIDGIPVVRRFVAKDTVLDSWRQEADLRGSGDHRPSRGGLHRRRA